MSLLLLCGCTGIPTWQIHADLRIDCHAEDCLDEWPSFDQLFGASWPAAQPPPGVCDWTPDAMIHFQAVFHHPDGHQDVGPQLALFVNEKREISPSSGTVSPSVGVYMFDADGSFHPAEGGALVNEDENEVIVRYISGRGQVIFETHHATGMGAQPMCPSQ
jgi:hypothetical protein